MAKDCEYGLGVSVGKWLALMLLLTVAGCSSQPGVPWRQTDLALAYADRGLLLEPDGSVSLNEPGPCNGPFKAAVDLRKCLSQHPDLILPALLDPGQIKAEKTPSQSDLVRALPANADFTDLQRQLKLFSTGRYLTWSGEVVPYPKTASTQNASRTVDAKYQPMALPAKHRPIAIQAPKIILQ